MISDKNKKTTIGDLTNDYYCDFVLNHKTQIDKVYEDEVVLAYHHTNPSWPVHIVVLPKRHISSLLECDRETMSALLQVIQQLAQQIMSAHGACRILTNLGNYQDSKHLHWHLYIENYK